MADIPLTPAPPAKFTDCEFIAHLKGITVTTKGKVVSLEVPFDRMDLVAPLERAVGVPLLISAQVWRPNGPDDE